MSADFEIELAHPGNGGQCFCRVGVCALDCCGGKEGGVIACIAGISESIRCVRNSGVDRWVMS
jgi:hypothetical protein